MINDWSDCIILCLRMCSSFFPSLKLYIFIFHTYVFKFYCFRVQFCEFNFPFLISLDREHVAAKSFQFYRVCLIVTNWCSKKSSLYRDFFVAAFMIIEIMICGKISFPVKAFFFENFYFFSLTHIPWNIFSICSCST